MDIIINIIQRAIRFTKIVLEFFCIFSIAAIISITFISVVSRYLFNSPLGWPMEYGLFLFIWLVYLGSALAAIEKEHFKVDFIVNLFPAKIQILVSIFNNLLFLVLSFIIIRVGVQIFPSLINRPMSVTIGRGWYLLAMIVCFGIMLMLFFKELLKDILKFRMLFFAPNGKTDTDR